VHPPVPKRSLRPWLKMKKRERERVCVWGREVMYSDLDSFYTSTCTSFCLRHRSCMLYKPPIPTPTPTLCHTSHETFTCHPNPNPQKCWSPLPNLDMYKKTCIHIYLYRLLYTIDGNHHQWCQQCQTTKTSDVWPCVRCVM
jgi:hypothetical protein